MREIRENRAVTRRGVGASTLWCGECAGNPDSRETRRCSLASDAIARRKIRRFLARQLAPPMH
jgi:hypothetical protein